MKTREKKELHTKDITELKKLLTDVNNSLHSLQLERQQGRLKNTRSYLIKRKELAVIQTIMREKEEQNA